MTSLAEAIDALEPVEAGWRGCVPDNWLQGRTAYGGFSAALALHAAKAAGGTLPALRSAQVAFVGPLSGALLVRAQVLREGRNAAFVEAEVEGEAGLGLRATFVFMAERASALDHHAAPPPAPPVPGPDADRLAPPPGINFAANFEMVRSSRESASPGAWRRWVRLRERGGLDPEVELVAAADALPPAALRLLGRVAPVSSITWQLDVTGRPETRGGWWLLAAETDHARAGFSAQRMSIRDADGATVATQVQGVGIFA